MREIKLQDLKSKTPAELVSFAEENGVENVANGTTTQMAPPIIDAKAESKFPS